MIDFIIKGLIRDRSRSLFPVLTIAAGTFLVVFLFSWIKGTLYDVINSSAKFNTGHVKVMTRAYENVSQQLANDLSIIGVNEMIEKLNSSSDSMIWTPRTRFGGLLDIPDDKGETRAQGPVIGLGVDLFSPDSHEKSILNLEKALVSGHLPEKKNEILISDDFAKKLGVRLGETATLLSSTMHSGMAMYNFTVSGTVRFGISAMDRGAMIADIRDVQIALDMPDASGEIVGYSDDMLFYKDKMSKLAKSFNKKFSREDDEFSPVMLSLTEQNNLDSIIQRVDVASTIIITVFLFAMSIVLWNTGLMNGLRRYGEIGVRLAMGEPKGTLYRWMLYESLLTGIIGTAIGTFFGLMVSYYLEYKGLDMSALMKGATIMMNNVMRARVTPVCYIIGFFPGLLAPLLGSLIAGRGIYKRDTSQLFKELEV